jgi:ATP-dependent DNA helicase RecG
VTIRGTLKSVTARFSFKTRRTHTEAVVSDSTGSLKVTWFNQGYIAKILTTGDEVYLSGKLELYKGLQLVNPAYEKLADHQIHTGRLVPVYKLPEDVYSRTFRRIIDTALPAAAFLKDPLPEHIRSAYNIPDIAVMTHELHFPSEENNITKAQERLAFEEALVQQLAVQQHKLVLESLAAPNITANINTLKRALAKLPFTLTDGQKKALWAILQDLEHKHPMNRLLQGEVGSGKTIVALLAALQVIAKGFQAAILVPTEILAKQHFDTFLKQLIKFKQPTDKIGLLTHNFYISGNGEKTKKELLGNIQKGSIRLVVGTHALLQDAVRFKNLALVVIDEQHRFGVEQRAELLKNMHKINAKQPWTPHLLSMTATPIPRTVALAMYSDLAVSSIGELPTTRKPIVTKLVAEPQRTAAYEFIAKEIQQGRQAFIITPLVEESVKLQVKSAKAEYERLQKTVFPRLRVGLLYGSMKGVDKDAVMQAFYEKQLDILVATSVIEIGIDIPNATVMLIEDADRFGLAQLHQLRGRVGRGEHQSYCLLFTNIENQESLERLEKFTTIHDGLKLATLDLTQRGFGSLFGTDQTGFAFKYGQYLSLKVLEAAKQAAETLTAEDRTLAHIPHLAAKAKPLSENLHLE